MKKIELVSTLVEDNTIRYRLHEDSGLGLLQSEYVDVFVRYHGNIDFDLNGVPRSILDIPVILNIIPITYFFQIEFEVPEMDKVLYGRLPAIYDSYSKIYGPFQKEWRGKIIAKKIVENSPAENSRYNKIVFFSGGVDACHAGINNPGKNTLLASIPDIECGAQIDGPLREEKISLIKNFSKVVESDWLLVSNNFNSLFNEHTISQCLSYELKLKSLAYCYDGWHGIRYLAGMCCVAPIAYLTGVGSLIMGSSFEQIEDKLEFNYDGGSPELSDAIGFCSTSFAEQEGLMLRRTLKVRNIIAWCKSNGKTTKIWTCFSDSSSQCGKCVKCIRTQLDILCASENPKEWGFDNFSERSFSRLVKTYKYCEFNPCWVWDIVDSINEDESYPYCNDLLHWLKKIGYRKYYSRAQKYSKCKRIIMRLASFKRYPYFIKIAAHKILSHR